MKNSRQSGFSLIEVLVVLVIITILASVVTVSVLRKPAEARVTAAQMQLQHLKMALNIYRTEQGRYPTQVQGLDALVQKPDSPPIPSAYPAEGYLDASSVPEDPWGNAFIYLVPGRAGEPFEVFSYGSDGEPGGAEDAADLSSSTP